MQTNQTISGVRRVTFYTACPVETCDRCGQGIKHVALVKFKDETTQRYGLDCINKILEGDTSLKGLFKKNQKLLATYTARLEILNRSIIPKGCEYYDSGMFLVVGDDGKAISVKGGAYCFTPMQISRKT